MKTIGIDLGTTNSVVASCENDPRSPRVLPNSSGENLTPSVVTAWRSAGAETTMLVGRPALNVAKMAPENTILSVKRLMGNDFADPKLTEAKKRFAYVVEPGPDGDPRAHVRLDGKLTSPVDVSAHILRQVKQDASSALGDDVRHAVITVPAYFEEKQRQATVAAGERAGLVVKRVIDEPTAAAIAFGIQSRSDKRHTVLVFDLGGGTFDVSLLQMTKSKDGREKFNVLGYDGDRWLGGDDMDRLILDKIIAEVRPHVDGDPTTDKRFLLEAKSKAEEVKKQLSFQDPVDVTMLGACKGRRGVVDVSFRLTRRDFEQMIQPLVERCMSCVQRLLLQQNVAADMISDVLLVGGATLTPLVRQTVERQFGAGKVRRSVNPMECVALGAAILAATLAGVECSKCATVNADEATQCTECGAELTTARSAGAIAVHEVTAMSLGIAAVDGDNPDRFVPIIKRGTPYPLAKPLTRMFKATDNRRIRVPVFEGDEPLASKNHEQGVVEYELPQEIDLASLIEVSFNYDKDRTLTVEIAVKASNLLPKRQVLERNRPRTSTAVTTETVAPDWRAELQQSVDFIGWFVGAYGAYIEPVQKARVDDLLGRSKKLLSEVGDEEGGKRADRELMAAFWGCGLATELHRAARATDGVPEELGAKINAAAAKVRATYDRGDRERANAEAAMLRTLVATAERTRDVKSVGDRRDFEGRLRLFGDGE